MPGTSESVVTRPSRSRVTRSLRMMGLMGHRVAGGARLPEFPVTVIADEQEAVQRGFTGSATFLVSRSDLFENLGQTVHLGCRIYRRPDGNVRGMPDLSLRLLTPVPQFLRSPHDGRLSRLRLTPVGVALGWRSCSPPPPTTKTRYPPTRVSAGPVADGPWETGRVANDDNAGRRGCRVLHGLNRGCPPGAGQGRHRWSAPSPVRPWRRSGVVCWTPASARGAPGTADRSAAAGRLVRRSAVAVCRGSVPWVR